MQVVLPRETQTGRCYKIFYRGVWTGTVGYHEGVRTSDFARALYVRRHPEMVADHIHAEFWKEEGA